MGEIERKVALGGDPDVLWPCLYLAKAEIDEFLAYVQTHATRPWVYPLIFFTAHTGARRSEVLRAELRDLDDEVVTIRERKREKGKKSNRRVPLTGPLKAVLADWKNIHPGTKYLFAQAGSPPEAVSRDAFVHHFGATVEGGKWAVLRGLHVLRHSFISTCASRGVDQRLIDEWVGHQTDEQRRRYRHLFPDAQKKALEDVFG